MTRGDVGEVVAVQNHSVHMIIIKQSKGAAFNSASFECQNVPCWFLVAYSAMNIPVEKETSASRKVYPDSS